MQLFHYSLEKDTAILLILNSTVPIDTTYNHRMNKNRLHFENQLFQPFPISNVKLANNEDKGFKKLTYTCY